MSLEVEPERAAVYCRISDDREGRALGVARQEQDCRALAERKGWLVAGLYVDNDISAADPRKRRPEYERLLEDIKSGLFDAVVVWDSDRLHRRPIELERFVEIAEAAGLRQLAMVGGDIDLAAGDGLLLARVKGAVAADEVAKIKRRVRRKHRQLAESGALSGGGTRPFGFDEDRLTVRESEAGVVRELVDRSLAGESIPSLCRDLNARGVMTATGKEWTPGSLRRLLTSGRIAGLREYEGESFTAQWPAIVPAESVLRLRELRAEKTRTGRRAPRKYLLSGLVVCGRCGARMVARPRDDGARRYVCAAGPGQAGCGKLMILADPVEELVSEAMLIRLDSAELATAWAGEVEKVDTDGIASGLDADEARLDELATAYGQRLVSLREYLKAREPIEARIDRARRELSRSGGTVSVREFVGHADRLRGVWDEMPIERRQAVIGAILDRVTVAPGVRGRNRFDPDRVTPTWKL